MDNKLTITLNLRRDSVSLPYALEIISEGIATSFIAPEFEKAEINGELLIDKNGTAPDNVKHLNQYNHIMNTLLGKY